MARSTKRVATLGAALVLMANGVSPALATSPPLKNIILVIMDDSSWMDYPFLSPAIKWDDPGLNSVAQDQDQPLRDWSDATKNGQDTREARIFSPDLNRSAARSHAVFDSGSQYRLGSRSFGATDCTSADSSGCVVPGDVNYQLNYTGTSNRASDFRFIDGGDSSGSCKKIDADPRKGNCANVAHKDILKNSGGLARLAREGARFSRFYAASALCGPSRASIFSGRHTNKTGATSNEVNDLDLNSVTIAEVLKGKGYKTAHLGKWHIGSTEAFAPTSRGFDVALWDAEKARESWATNPIRCNAPVKACSIPPAYQSTNCFVTPCGDGYVCGRTAGLNRFFCYKKSPKTGCQTNADCVAMGEGASSTCEWWGYFLGDDPGSDRMACHPKDAPGNPECCTPPASGDPLKGGEYKFLTKFDRTKPYRCGTTDTECDPAANSCGTTSCSQNSYWRKDGETSVRGEERYTCNEEGTATGDRCVYDLRRHTNQAIKLLKRFDTGASAAPVFISIAWHEPHHPAQATARVEAHYMTGDSKGLRPVEPNEAVLFWAAMEEADAAVGKLLTAIKDSANGLQHQTIVLFTADHGRATNNYGSPILRGGKSETLEGGIRIPLFAWDSSTAGSPNTTVNALGSQVDLLTTAAAVAGYKLDKYGRAPELGICSHTTGGPPHKVCETDTDCAVGTPGLPGQTGATCVKPGNSSDPSFPGVWQGLSGRTLLGNVCSNAESSGSVKTCGSDSDCVSPGTCGPPKQRNFTYAQLNYDKKAIVSRDGYYFDKCDTDDPKGTLSTTEYDNCAFATGMCGYEVTKVALSDGYDPGTRPRVWHTIRGSSKTACYSPSKVDPNAGANNHPECGSSVCEVLGGVCIPADDPMSTMDEYSSCTDNSGTTACPVGDRQRCRSNTDCKDPAFSVCANVKTKCNRCIATAWKARAVTESSAPDEIFDLASNPEELASKNVVFDDCYMTGTSPCTSCQGMATLTPSESRICRVQKDLKCRMNDWWGCGSLPCENTSDSCGSEE